MFLALRRMALGEQPSLTAIQEDLSLGPAFIDDLFAEVIDAPRFHQLFDGVLVGMAKSMRGVLAKAGPQFSGGFGVAEQALRPYRKGGLANHTSGSSFDPRILKSTKEKVAVFVCYTLEKSAAYSVPMGMTLGYLFDTLTTVKSPRRVTAIIDEAGLTRIPKIGPQLNSYRKLGLRALLIYQDIEGQTLENYNRATLQQILAACQYKIAKGVQEPSTLEMFSKMCGTKRANEYSRSDASIWDSSMSGLSQTDRGTEKPVMRPEDIRLLESDKMLVVGSNLHPMVTRAEFYLDRPEWRAIVGPSPFHDF